MDPGIYENLTYEQYDAIDAVRSTQLKPYFISARRGRWAEKNPKTGRHFSLGRAVHTAISEPAEFDKRYAVLGQCTSTIQSGKRKGEQCTAPGVMFNDGRSLCGMHGDESLHTEQRECITAGENKTVICLQAALMERPDITRYLTEPHYTERVLVWEDPETGLKCKCRIDHQARDEYREITDLKSTSAENLKPRTLSREIWKFRYDFSLGWYRRGCRALDIPTDAARLVFLQTTYDMDVASYSLHEDALDQGEGDAVKALRTLAKARETGRYPGVQKDSLGCVIALPEYAQQDPMEVFNG